MSLSKLQWETSSSSTSLLAIHSSFEQFQIYSPETYRHVLTSSQCSIIKGKSWKIKRRIAGPIMHNSYSISVIAKVLHVLEVIFCKSSQWKGREIRTWKWRCKVGDALKQRMCCYTSLVDLSCFFFNAEEILKHLIKVTEMNSNFFFSLFPLQLIIPSSTII